MSRIYPQRPRHGAARFACLVLKAAVLSEFFKLACVMGLFAFIGGLLGWRG